MLNTLPLKGRVVMWLIILFASSSFFAVAQQQTIERNGICMDPIAGRGAYINSVNTGLCLLCSATDGANVIDGNLTNFSTLTTGVSVGLLGGAAVSVKDSLQYYPAGNAVGFVVKYNGGLLSLNILNALQIRTFRNGALQETASFTSGSGLLSAAVLSNESGKQILKFTTTKDFDEVQLFAPSTLTALSSIDVYYAFEGPANCPSDCVNALTGSAEVGTPNFGGASLVCLGGVSGLTNLSDSDTTNFAAINILLGLGCTYYIDVPLNFTASPNTFVGFAVNNGGGLLDATLLSNITVTTYNGSNPTALNTFSGGSLLSANVLSGSSSIVQVGGKITQPCTRLRISASSLLSLAYTLRVYYAFIKTDADNDGVYDCMDKCNGNDLLDTDGDGLPNACDNDLTDLNITKVVNVSDTVSKGTDVTFTLTINRIANSESATGLKIKDLLPPGLTYVSHTAPVGTFYNPTTGIWNVGSALSGSFTSLALSLVASADSSGVLSNVAEVISVNENDPDSTPGNGTSGTGASEDDIATACVSVPFFLCPSNTLKLTAPLGSTSYQWYRNGVIIAGATDSVYVITQSGSYTFNSPLASGCASGNCCPVVAKYSTLVANAGVAPAPICAGSSVTLTGSGGGTYSWSNGATTASITVAPTTTQDYILTVTRDGCTAKDTVTVSVKSSPLTPGVLSICNNAGTTSTNTDDTFTFTLNPTGGTTTYTVSGGVTGGPFNYGQKSTAFGPFLISGGSKSIVITDTNGCSLSATVTAPATCSNCPATPICVPVTVRLLK